MAGRTVYGGSDMAVFLQNEGFSANTFEPFLTPSTSHSGFNGSRSMLNFEEVCRSSTINQAFYRPRELEEIYDDDFDDCLHHPEKKRRLTSDQVQFLEKSFEVENKLEPERKVELAKDLGLQPRQVAIWFQNRRARWKNKQLEKDYDDLKSTYNALKSEFDSLLKEKEKLKTEVVHLTDKLLLKEGHKESSQEFELKEPDYGSLIEMKLSKNQVVEEKQEDGSSSNSNIFESESPRYTDGALTDSSILFEPNQSDISHVEENEEVREYHEFLKLADDTSASFEFPVEDHTFWFWA